MIESIGALIGGLGLFLLAISMITDGLKLAAGNKLRDILATSTATPFRGVASGVLVTGMVQSSSAVTVATIGFVNAGLLTMVEALGLVYGANIGTTMTGWLVAAIGFEFKIEIIALPLVGIGMALRLTGKASRIGAAGEALAGFGLFFIGIDILKEAFATYATSLDATAITSDTGFGLLVFVLFGFISTLVTQSSSAAIAITLTAATSGLLAIDAAAAMVIGANVGTTSTAIFSVLGATPNAKRVAAAHVVFNLVTGVVALALLPVMLALVNWTGSALDLGDIPAVTLALFHTVFNVLGVLLMWPLTTRLAHFLSRRFRSPVEDLSRPVHLDKNVLVTPGLAIDALALELQRIADMSRTLAIGAIKLTKHPPPELTHLTEAINSLTTHVENFISSLERDRLSTEMSQRLPIALRINTYIEEVNHLAQETISHVHEAEALKQGDIARSISTYTEQSLAILSLCDINREDFDKTALEAAYDELRRDWHNLKASLLVAAANNTVPINRLNLGLETLRSYLRIVEQTVKLTSQLKIISTPAKPVDANLPSSEAQAA
jgi:phosphate:Na+ symporter